MKTCSRCNITKELGLFPKAPSCADGHRSYCKACEKLRKDDWRSRNKEHHNAKGKLWVLNNKEKRKETSRKYRSKPEVRAKEPEYKAAYRERHSMRARAQLNLGRVNNRSIQPKWADEKKMYFFYLLAQHESERRGETYVVDHVIPRNGKLVCGLHVENNMQVITKSANDRKHNKYEVR